MGLLLGILTVFLVLVSIFMVLVVLAQRAKSDGGVGAALGGGMAEAAFGAESGNVLTKATQWSAVLFFVLAFALYLGHIYQHKNSGGAAPFGLPSSPDLLPVRSDAAIPPATEPGVVPPTVEPVPSMTPPAETVPPAPEATPPTAEGATPSTPGDASPPATPGSPAP